MDTIRVIKDTDYPILDLYWAMAGCHIDSREMYPHESSYIFERDGRPLYAVAAHLIRGLPMAYIEAVIRDPNKRPDFDALYSLQSYLEVILKAQGYTRIIGIPKNEQLCKHYEKLGYNRVDAVIYTVKEL